MFPISCLLRFCRISKPALCPFQLRFCRAHRQENLSAGMTGAARTCWAELLVVAVISGDRGLIPNPREIAPLPGVGRNIPSGEDSRGQPPVLLASAAARKRKIRSWGWEKTELKGGSLRGGQAACIKEDGPHGVRVRCKRPN